MIRSRRYAGGFTLIEVLVAFIVLAMSLGVIMNIFSLSMRTTATAESKQYALLLAESKMDELTGEPEVSAGRSAGEFDDTYSWKARIEPWEFPDQDPVTVYPFTPYLVEVTVQWGESEAQELMISAIHLVSEDEL